MFFYFFFFFQAEDGIRDVAVTGVQTCALPISSFVDAADEGELFFALDVYFYELTFFHDGNPALMGGCVDNQFFRHENSLSLAVAKRLPGRIAAVRVPLAVREGRSVPRVAGTHAGRTSGNSGFVSTNLDTRTEAAKRSLLKGNRLFLKLTRLVRS